MLYLLHTNPRETLSGAIDFLADVGRSRQRAAFGCQMYQHYQDLLNTVKVAPSLAIAKN